MSIEPYGKRPSRRQGRSRKYPAEPLPRAIERAQVVYEREGRHAAPVIEIVRHWGYGSHTSGAASTAYSAVRQFGLIAEEGRGEDRIATLTDLAFEILRSPNPAKAIVEAMMTPPTHVEMWEEFGKELPSERTLHWKLVRESGFTETGATEFIKQYRESLAFVLENGFLEQPEGEANLPEPPEPSSQPPSVASPLQSPVAVRPRSSDAQDVWRDSRTGEMHYVAHPGPVMTEKTKRHAIPLAGGKQVVLEGDFPLSEAAWRQFLIVLDAFKPGLVEDELVRAVGQAPELSAAENSADDVDDEVVRGDLDPST